MASPLDLANRALALIGARADVASIDPPEASVEAQACALHWPAARDEALSLHAWSFALRRVVMADITTTHPAPAGWLYSYALPSDMIRIIGIRAAGGVNDLTLEAGVLESVESGPVFYTNAVTPSVQYVKQENDSTRYPFMFATGVEHLLAGRIAGQIIRGLDGIRLGAAMREQGMAYLNKARVLDANQSRRDMFRGPYAPQASWNIGRSGPVTLPDG